MSEITNEQLQTAQNQLKNQLNHLIERTKTLEKSVRELDYRIFGTTKIKQTTIPDPK